ncbi:MAG: carbohydrate-binding family 9-like protein [Desulfamplus sp.]|nr:carbohydrate-binding family 9-like protein [Desulfamplus sp.]
MECKVKRQTTPLKDNTDWDSSSWRDIPSELLKNYMGSRPDHFPKTEVKIVYDDTAIYLMFRVEDRYVRAAAKEHQGNVWEDSCVEFFFTPNSDLSVGYFNLEMNCGGTMLFHFHPEADIKEKIVIPKSECSQIVCSHSLPQIVVPEIREPVTWTVSYSIPIALLRRYCKVITPALNVEWRANFYKCADKTSHPHWLTWSPVDFPKPNFHIPESFGILKFE